VNPFVTQYTLKDIFDLDKTALFYNAQPKTTPVLKGEKCQGGTRYKDHVTILLCCSAGGKKLHPLIVRQFEKPHSL